MTSLIPPYNPIPDTAAALTVWLGHVSLQGSISDAGSPAVSTLTVPITSWGISFGGFSDIDVGDIVQFVSAVGSPAVYTIFWTTIVSVVSSTEVVLAESTSACTGAQVTVYRPFTEEFNNPNNYILQDSITFDSSITTRPTLDFTAYSGDRAVIPQVGQPVLLTDSMLDGSVVSYTIAGGGGSYAVGDFVEFVQTGAPWSCNIQVDAVSGGAITASHIVITPETGNPGGFGYVVANGVATQRRTGSGSGATVNITGVTGPAFSASPGYVFGGSIEQAKVYNYPGSTPVKIECQCVSWDAILNHRVLGMTSAFPVSNTTLDFNGGQEQQAWSPVWGTQRYFILGSPPPVAIISITVNGVAQTLGPISALPPVGGGGYQFYWSFGVAFQLTVDPSRAPFNDSDSIIVTIEAVTPQVPSITYQNMTPDLIVLALMEFIQNAEGITIANVVNSLTASPFTALPTVNAITFLASQTVDEALASLMTYINDGTTNFWYYIDPQKGFHFEILGVTTVAPWNIIESDGSDANVQMDVSALTTREKYANAAWIDSQEVLPAITQVFSGNSTATTFNVTYPVGATPTIVFCAGIGPTPPPNPPAPYSFGGVTYPETQTVGVLGGSGDDWYWSPGSPQITQDGSFPPISDTECIYVTYAPDIGLIQPYPSLNDIPDAAMIARQMIEGGSGEYDTTIDLSSQLPFVQGAPAQSAAANIAQQIVLYFQNMSQQADVETYRPGLAPGQSIQIDIPGVVGN